MQNAFSDDKSNLFKGNKRDMQLPEELMERFRLLDATFFNEFMLV